MRSEKLDGFKNWKTWDVVRKIDHVSDVNAYARNGRLCADVNTIKVKEEIKGCKRGEMRKLDR